MLKNISSRIVNIYILLKTTIVCLDISVGIMTYLILKIEFLHSLRTKSKLKTNHSGEPLCDY